MLTPNKEIIREACAALRSGEYQQGFYVLGKVGAKKTCHCIWGVFCELGVKHGVIQRVVEYDVVEYGGYETTPPPAIEDWIGIDKSTQFPIPTKPHEHDTLMGLNDAYQCDFLDFADILEKKYLQEA